MFVDSLQVLVHICKRFQSLEYSLNMIKNIVKLIQNKALITLLHLSITFFLIFNRIQHLLKRCQTVVKKCKYKSEVCSVLTKNGNNRSHLKNVHM